MNIDEIRNEIEMMEQADTTWQNIQRLAWLYTVHDHMADGRNPIVAHEIRNVMPEYAGEFGQAVSGRKIDDLMSVLSEHMAVIKILHPKEYQAVIERISEASQ